MTLVYAGDPANKEELKLPRKDWVLLPLLSLLTICLIAFSAELISRQVFFESKTTTLRCLVVNDPATGVRAIPNSVCSQKIFESKLTEYRINSRGHRAGMECGPKLPGTYRIVLVGSSFAYGMWVPREQSFAALLPTELSQRTGRRVELYNEAMQWGTPHSVDLRFKEALAAKPDMILWALTPWDIQNVQLTIPYVAPQEGARNGTFGSGEAGNMLARIWHRVVIEFDKKSITVTIRAGWKRVVDALDQTRTVFLLQHILYQSQSQYVKHYLMQGEEAAFLRAEPSAAWQDQLQHFDSYAVDVEAQARAAGITVVAVLLPQRAQAAMISMGEWPVAFDPYKIGEQVRSIIESHGGTYIDVLRGIRNIPNPERYYFPVDGHLNAEGHAIFSELLAKGLISAPGVATAPSAASRVTR